MNYGYLAGGDIDGVPVEFDEFIHFQVYLKQQPEPWRTPIAEITVAAQHARILARRDRGASFDLWVYRRLRRWRFAMTDTRFERVTFRTGI